MLLRSVITWALRKRIHQIELFQKYPHDVQNDVLSQLLETAKDTEWGRRYDFASIKSTEDFQQRIPVQSYEQIFPEIERLLQGEQNILWPGKIEWFAKSSGTTNARSKFIPVSEEALEDCHFKCGKDMLSLYVNNYPHQSLLSGKALMLGGSHQPNPDNPKASFGDVSAVLMRNLPFWASMRRVPSLKTALLEKWDDKIERMIAESEYEDVTSISGVPTWTLVLFHRILERHGKSNMLEIWPNLELFMHGAVSFEPYRAQFEELIPSSQMSYQETYNASEGFFAIQDERNRRDMLLMLDYGIFYEFVPMNEWGKEYPEVKQLHEVELDQNYAVVISTNAGLWRYAIGDTVRFTSIDPYRIRVTGRTKHFINAFGEEVIVENADEALRYACDNTGAVMKNYTAAPVFMQQGERGGHEWLLEFEKEPVALEDFSQLLDQRLREINSDYDAKRFGDIALVAPLIRVLPLHSFDQWMEKRGKLGGQNKVPRLSNSREYVDDILELVYSEVN